MPRKSSIRKRKSGRYEARYREADGTQRGRTFDTEDEAKSFLATVTFQVQTGDYVKPEAGRVTFGEVAADWMNTRRLKGLKASTLDGYAIIVRTWLDPWRATPIGRLTPGDVRKLMADMDRSASTKRNVYNIVKGVFDLAVKNGYVRVNPCTAVRDEMAPVKSKTARFLSAHDVQRLAAALTAPYDLLVLTAAWTGLRRGELAGLRAGRVDTKRHRIHVVETVVVLSTGEHRQDTPKSDRSNRQVPLPPTLSALLATHIKDNGLTADDYVWTEDAGEPLRMSRFYRGEYKRACKEVGLTGLRFHDLRHTYASLMAKQGEHIGYVSRWMGHSTIAITMDLYTHIFEEDDERLSNRLDEAFTAGQAVRLLVVGE